MTTGPGVLRYTTHDDVEFVWQTDAPNIVQMTIKRDAAGEYNPFINYLTVPYCQPGNFLVVCNAILAGYDLGLGVGMGLGMSQYEQQPEWPTIHTP